MQNIHKAKGRITCIPNNPERYISFSVGQFVFKDTFQLMAASLSKLADGYNHFDLTDREFGNKAHLMKRKGIYPYEYIDSFSKFKELLPPIEAFCSKLNDESVSQADYEHAQKIWNKFNCKNMGDYHDIYLKSHVTLLGDVFQTFRETCLKSYELDPAHYFTAPGLSWDALLKYTKAQPDYLHDIDMHLFTEKGMRGGLSMVSKRY